MTPPAAEPDKIRTKTLVLTYSFRLPDTLQPQALAMLNMAKREINSLLAVLWPNLVSFSKSDSNARSQIEAAYPKAANSAASPKQPAESCAPRPIE